MTLPQTTGLEAGGCVCGLEMFTPGHDAFAWGALNGSGLEVAMVLGPNEFGLTVAELSAQTGRHPQTIRTALKRLEEMGMAKAEPKTWPRRWTFTVRDLKEVARELGVDGRQGRAAEGSVRLASSRVRGGHP